MIETRITEMIGIKYPIFLGGMTGISDGFLASAVSEAGGLGIISAGMDDGNHLISEMEKCCERTVEPFGVNVLLTSPYVKEIANIIAEYRVPVVTTGAGDPSKYIPMWKDAGCTVIPVVGSTVMAERAERAGADAVIAEGSESGGHIGNISTFVLVPAVSDTVYIPVIAAGGIANGRGMTAAFALGAEGVQIGTRFIVSKECRVHPGYKERIIKSRDNATMVLGRNHPVRVLRTELARELLSSGEDSLPMDAYIRAVKEGDGEGLFLSGQDAMLINKELSVEQITEEIAEEFENFCKQLNSYR